MDPSTDGVGTPEAVGSLTWPESAISESPPDTVGSMTDHFAGDPRTNWERMLAGDLYIANDPENARIADRGARLADAYHRLADRAGVRSPYQKMLAALWRESPVPRLQPTSGWRSSTSTAPTQLCERSTTTRSAMPSCSRGTSRPQSTSGTSRDPTSSEGSYRQCSRTSKDADLATAVDVLVQLTGPHRDQ